jgi:hypothetical protein
MLRPDEKIFEEICGNLLSPLLLGKNVTAVRADSKGSAGSWPKSTRAERLRARAGPPSPATSPMRHPRGRAGNGMDKEENLAPHLETNLGRDLSPYSGSGKGNDPQAPTGPDNGSPYKSSKLSNAAAGRSFYGHATLISPTGRRR